MPTHGYLLCTECRLSVLLGTTTAGPDMTIRPLTDIAHRPPWQLHPLNTDLCRAIWRLVNEHAGHVLRVVAECWPEFDTYTAVELAGVYPTLPSVRPAYQVSDITVQAYTFDWPSAPAVTHYRGATPAPGRLTRDGEVGPTAVSLFCLPCRIAVDLGDTTIQPDGTATTFTTGTDNSQPSCLDPIATTALLRLLIDHAGHDLLAFPLSSLAYDHYIEGEWVLHIHRDADRIEQRGEITWAQYTDGWPYAPAYRRHIGITPVARRHCVSGGRSHYGCHHPHPPRRLDLDDTTDPEHRPSRCPRWLWRLLTATSTRGS